MAAGEANGKTLHARRLVLAELPDTEVVGKLFDTLAPRFAERPGGYTRILRVGFRRGDSAEVAHVELVGSEYNPAATAEKDEGEEAPKKAKGVGERLKRAAQRIRAAARATADPRPRRAVRPRAPHASPRRHGKPADPSLRQVQNAKVKVDKSTSNILLTLTFELPTYTSSATTCPRSAFAAAMIFAWNACGTSS